MIKLFRFVGKRESEKVNGKWKMENLSLKLVYTMFFSIKLFSVAADEKRSNYWLDPETSDNSFPLANGMLKSEIIASVIELFVDW